MKWWKIALISAVGGVATTYVTYEIAEKEVMASLESPPEYTAEGRTTTIVVPALEEQDYLPSLLKSIGNQTYRPIEVIISDSSSGEPQEATKAICDAYGAKYVHSPPGNISRARNVGAENASGEILMFVDADCILSPDYVEKIVDVLEDGYVLAHGFDPIVDGRFYGMASVVGRGWLKAVDQTTRGVGIWRDAFWFVSGYDEGCNPLEGCREDLKLGRDVRDAFGADSMKFVRWATIGTSARRERRFGFRMWTVPGVRNHVLE